MKDTATAKPAVVDDWQERAEAAEAALAAIPWGAIALVDTYSDYCSGMHQAKNVVKAWRQQYAPPHLRA